MSNGLTILDNKTILWLSRHPMTEQQLEALGNDVVIKHLNVTFPAKGSEAAEHIHALAKEHGAKTVAAVLPAHVMSALYERCLRLAGWGTAFEPVGLKIMSAVSVPAVAKEGETRGSGFVFSHWESVVV
jgi:sugar/nucleoside kinase (ribokinase family)